MPSYNKICLSCKKKFIAHRTNKKFCNKKCKDYYNQRGLEKKCVCGKLITNKANYCSNCNKKEKATNWKGKNASYASFHKGIRKHKPKPLFCEICRVNSPKEVAKISKRYTRDIKDYLWLCISCHRKLDWENRKKWNLKNAKQYLKDVNNFSTEKMKKKYKFTKLRRVWDYKYICKKIVEEYENGKRSTSKCRVTA